MHQVLNRGNAPAGPTTAFSIAVIFLAGCSMLPAGGNGPSAPPASFLSVPAMTELANLDYGNGSITVYRIVGETATVRSRFTPSESGAQGIALDRQGLVYTTVGASNADPCAACVEVFTPDGKLVARLSAPVLPGAKNPPSLSDISVDARGNIYVSDEGQQAVYFYAGYGNPHATPTIVVQKSENAASVLATPDGDDVFVSGGCGLASVRPYVRVHLGEYRAGHCFQIGTIALIGGATDNDREVLTPVDGGLGLVSATSPAGGSSFLTPDRMGSISGIAMTGDGTTAYVADHHDESVYAFERPGKGWIAGGQPKVLASIRGFKGLDIIAVSR